MEVHRYQMNPELRPYVSHYWEIKRIKEGADFLEPVLPSAPIHLLIQMKDLIEMNSRKQSMATRLCFAAFVTTPDTNYIRTGKEVAMSGITFTPLGFWKIFKFRPAEFLNEVIPYEAVTKLPYPSVFDKHLDQSSILERLTAVEAWIKQLLHTIDFSFTRQDILLHHLQKGVLSPKIPVTDLPLSLRQSERITQEILGLSPKYFQRLSRFSVVMGLLMSGKFSLEDIAFQCGFYDPAHLRKELEKIGGMSVRELIEKSRCIQDNAYDHFSKNFIEN